MKIEPGKMDRLVEFLDAAPQQDELGQVIEDFADLNTTYAQRLEMRTQDAARGGQRETFAVSRYLIRYRTGLKTSMRCRIDAKVYDIVAIDEPDRRKSLILTVEEVTR